MLRTKTSNHKVLHSTLLSMLGCIEIEVEWLFHKVTLKSLYEAHAIIWVYIVVSIACIYQSMYYLTSSVSCNVYLSSLLFCFLNWFIIEVAFDIFWNWSSLIIYSYSPPSPDNFQSSVYLRLQGNYSQVLKSHASPPYLIYPYICYLLHAMSNTCVLDYVLCNDICSI